MRSARGLGTPGILAAMALREGENYQITATVDLYDSAACESLATQAWEGRFLRLCPQLIDESESTPAARYVHRVFYQNIHGLTEALTRTWPFIP